ncbi:sigma factor-like helix-turn-helix DNA-binding protein [Halorussus litoreus]|uniref:sigma-70 region 4 domain-containing protein n=1 Tax=Halorussus litoreus TaxID=1710536 RepID=UPI000E275D9E|nr:sigma-70 region 4 domain-containing protein [Halorussus litoreus]
MAGQSDFTQFTRDLTGLSRAERQAYLACAEGETGVREFARETGRSPGTVGNLLGRARDKLDDAGGQT